MLESVLQSPSLPKHYISCISGEPAICSVFISVAQHPCSNPGLLIVEVWKLHSVRNTPLEKGSARRSAVSFKGYSAKKDDLWRL